MGRARYLVLLALIAMDHVNLPHVVSEQYQHNVSWQPGCEYRTQARFQNEPLLPQCGSHCDNRTQLTRIGTTAQRWAHASKLMASSLYTIIVRRSDLANANTVASFMIATVNRCVEQ